MDDRELALGLRAGNPEAVRQFVQRFQDDLFRLCARLLQNRHDAEDVVQEVLVRAIRSIASFDLDRPFRPWLTRIAINRCQTLLASRSRRPERLESGDSWPDHRPSLTDVDDLSGELDRALDQLRPEYRAVFLMFHQQALPYEEISRVIDRPVGTVKTWLHRARAELAERLQRKGVLE